MTVGLTAATRARWLGGLVVDPVLPERVVVIRNEAVAHAWRRDLAVVRPELLIGTRFVTPIALAVSVLERAGVRFSLGEEVVRAARVRALFAEGLELRAFDLAVLRDGRGWSEAMAATLGVLEGATLDAERLRANGDARCADLAEIMERMSDRAGTSWSSARLLREAASLVHADPGLWPFGGATLVEVTGHEVEAHARFVRAIPRSQLVSIAVRPLRSAHVARLQKLFPSVEDGLLVDEGTSELALLGRYLFEKPGELASPTRRRSSGVDGTVQLEEHAGLEEELGAAVTWVAGEVADRKTPLEQILIVVPQIDPYATLLRDRIEGMIPDSVHVVGGVPALVTPAGARIATILRGLDGFLHIDVLADMLPTLKLEGEDVQISRRDAIAVLYELGSVGGSSTRREGAFEWVTRAAIRRDALARAVEETTKDEDSELELRDLTRKLTHLNALVRPLVALDRVARAVIDNVSLAVLWGELRELLSGHVRLGADGARITAVLDEAVRPLVGAGILKGEVALATIATTLSGVRLPVGRFGDSRITIAALSDAVGLTARAVRVLGLAEGSIPSNVREDPVLPDSARRALDERIPLSFDRSLAQLHALHGVVLGATERIVWSVGRMDAGRRYREPSGVLLEAAAAIGRPPLGTNGSTIPDLAMLRTSAFEPARVAIRGTAMRWPVHVAGQLDRAARQRVVPIEWHEDGLFSLGAFEPANSAAGIMDGWFPDGPFMEVPGSSAERPISASALSRLLECPHRFLYERLLGWSAPPKLGEEGSIDALSYGSLFHETAEAFYKVHGTAFCAHAEPLDAYKRHADDVADQRFATFLESYPLVGDEIRAAARGRLRRDLRALLVSDWEDAKTFVAVERGFGPLALPLGGGIVHVRGYIDRIDKQGEVTLVRDLKTGRAKRRKADVLLPSYDVQLGLYGLVTRMSATAWEVPTTVHGAYVYPADPSGDERGFHDDFDTLAHSTESWIALAMDLANARMFPRTPLADDCQFCPFKPVCGPKAQARAGALLAGAVEPARRFALLKLGDDETQ